jgi:hypothetical protein
LLMPCTGTTSIMHLTSFCAAKFSISCVSSIPPMKLPPIFLRRVRIGAFFYVIDDKTNKSLRRGYRKHIPQTCVENRDINFYLESTWMWWIAAGSAQLQAPPTGHLLSREIGMAREDADSGSCPAHNRAFVRLPATKKETRIVQNIKAFQGHQKRNMDCSKHQSVPRYTIVISNQISRLHLAKHQSVQDTRS